MSSGDTIFSKRQITLGESRIRIKRGDAVMSLGDPTFEPANNTGGTKKLYKTGRRSNAIRDTTF